MNPSGMTLHLGTKRKIAFVLTAFSLLTGCATVTEAPSAARNCDAEQQTFLYLLWLRADKQNPDAWSDAERAAMDQHRDHLVAEAAAGRVLMAGRTDERPDTTTGIVVFCAADRESAEAFAKADPAVAAGVMQARVSGFRQAAP